MILLFFVLCLKFSIFALNFFSFFSFCFYFFNHQYCVPPLIYSEHVNIISSALGMNLVVRTNIQNQTTSILATKTKLKTIWFAIWFSRLDVKVHVQNFVLNTMFTIIRHKNYYLTDTKHCAFTSYVLNPTSIIAVPPRSFLCTMGKLQQWLIFSTIFGNFLNLIFLNFR